MDITINPIDVVALGEVPDAPDNARAETEFHRCRASLAEKRLAWLLAQCMAEDISEGLEDLWMAESPDEALAVIDTHLIADAIEAEVTE